MDTDTLIVVGSIGLTLLAFNGVLLGIIFFTHRKAAQARDWPSATGTVKVSTLETRRSSDQTLVNYPVVIYTYRVMGQDYESRRVTPGMEWGGTGAGKVVARYPAGSQVKVYYNEKNPSEAMLETKAPGWMIWLWIALVIFDLFLCGTGAVVVWALGVGG